MDYEQVPLEDPEAEVIIPSRRQHSSLQNQVNDIIQRLSFQMAMALAILVNAAVIGGETDLPDLGLWAYVENILLLIFTAELCLRIFADGPTLFFDYTKHDFLWNLFDFFIVGLGLFDAVAQLIVSKQKGGGFATLFRMIRLLRILRIFKIVKFLKQLYLLAFGFIEAFQAVFWVTILMLFLLYICSIIMVRCYGRLHEQDRHKVLREQFGSIGISMLSLFELMSDPGNLRLYHSVMGEFPTLTGFLIGFVIFGSFGMIALLTGVISESMFEKNQVRAAEERTEREKRRKDLQSRVADIYLTIDRDENGEASVQQLKGTLIQICEIFEKMGIDYQKDDMDGILEITDNDDSGKICQEEFVQAILSLADGVRPMSIQELFHLTSQIRAKIMAMDPVLDALKAIPELQANMAAIMAKMNITPPPPVRLSQAQSRPAVQADSYPTLRGNADGAGGRERPDELSAYAMELIAKQNTIIPELQASIAELTMTLNALDMPLPSMPTLGELKRDSWVSSWQHPETNGRSCTDVAREKGKSCDTLLRTFCTNTGQQPVCNLLVGQCQRTRHSQHIRDPLSQRLEN